MISHSDFQSKTGLRLVAITLVVFWVVLSACEAKRDSEFPLSTSDIQTLLFPNSEGARSLERTLVLISGPTQCMFCLEEIKYWNVVFESNIAKFDIFLLLVGDDPDELFFYLNRNSITLPVKLALQSHLPDAMEAFSLPIKIWIDESNEVHTILPVGDGKDHASFFRKINR